MDAFWTRQPGLFSVSGDCRYEHCISLVYHWPGFDDHGIFCSRCDPDFFWYQRLDCRVNDRYWIDRNINISVEVDGILYLQVVDAVKASYGIENYMFASVQLAQTTMRSEIGKLELDRTFEEREAKINVAEGVKQEAIKGSEGEKTKRINEAEGRSKEIELIALATAEGIWQIAAIQEPGGKEAVNLRVAEQYLKEFGNLAKVNNTMILPSNLTDIAGVVATISSLLKTIPPTN